MYRHKIIHKNLAYIFASLHKKDLLCTTFPTFIYTMTSQKVIAAHARGRRRNGLLAISPMFLLALALCAAGVCFGDFYKVPLLLIFIFVSAYALCIAPGRNLTERIAHFSRGAGSKNLLLMVWIFVLAGAFAESAHSMGAIDATVACTLSVLPPSLLLPGIFAASCFVSMCIGTSVGTIVALVPIATGLSDQTGITTGLLVASVVGGAFFGDNLSFISDTTIAATRTQGCQLRDKFKVNFRLALPAAIIAIILYIVLGSQTGNAHEATVFSWDMLLLMLPYCVVLFSAMAGLDVLLVLFIGNLLTGVIGIANGSFDTLGWFSAMATGISGMGELILISMIAGGLLELIRVGGGITFVIHRLTRRVNSRRGGELSIAVLVSLVNLCTANNTVAILSVGKMANDIAERFGIDKRRSASLLDTFSCIVQSFIPYGAQLLMAGGLAAISPFEIIPYLYYPMLLAVVCIAVILFQKQSIR